jgi:peptidyl-prolyl cis-trans isomerase D
MLQKIRLWMQSWPAKIFIAILAASFVLWGVGDVVQSWQNRSVAKVGNEKISIDDYALEFKQTLTAYQKKSPEGQGEISLKKALSLGWDRAILHQMIKRIALRLETERLNLGASDSLVIAEIKNMDSFRDFDGEFNAPAYRKALRNTGYKEWEFESTVRMDIVRNQLLTAVTANIQFPHTEIAYMWQRFYETRNVSYIILDKNMFSPPPPDEEDILTFFNDNKDNFFVPERRSSRFFVMDEEFFLKRYEVENGEIREEDIRHAYEQNMNHYYTPEMRDVDQITFPVENDAKLAYVRLKNGELMEKIAQEIGMDTKDISLGKITPDDLTGARGEAVFSSETTGILPPIKTAFGWALVRINAINAEHTISFEEAHDSLHDALIFRHLGDSADKVIEGVYDSIASGASLDDIAGEFDLSVYIFEAKKNTGADNTIIQKPDDLQGFSGYPLLLETMFITNESELSDLVRYSDSAFFIAETTSITAAYLPDLEIVRDNVIESWKKSQTKEKLQKEATSDTTFLDQGMSLQDIAQKRDVHIPQILPCLHP